MECFYLCSDVVYTAHEGTALRVFGVLRDGEKVAVLVRGFRDSVDVRLPDALPNPRRACACLLEQLNQALAQHHLFGLGYDRACDGDRVGREPVITRQTSVMGFSERGEADFLRVYVKEPFMLPVVEGLLRAPLPHVDGELRKRGWLTNEAVARVFFRSVTSLRESEQDLSRYSFELFNGTSLDYRMKCTHHLNLKPCTWFVIPPGARETRGDFTKGLREFTVSGRRPFEAAEGIPPTQLLRCVGFDIECLSTTGQFPDARRDPVITVSVCAHRLSEMGIKRGAGGLAVAGGDVMERHVLQLGSVDSDTISDSTPAERFANVDAPAPCRLQAFPFDEDDADSRARAEVRLLRALVALLRELRPDILYSFNGNGFDLPYLLTRCETLGGALLRDFKRALSLGGGGTRVVVPMQHKFVKANGYTGVGGGKALVPDTVTYSEKEVKTSALGHQVRAGRYAPVTPQQRPSLCIDCIEG